MSREELLEYICFTNYTNECSACDGRYNCQDCKDAINPLLDTYDKQIRNDVIDEYKNKLWEDIETRYKNDIKILGYLSAENLLRDVHNAICYFAKQLKEKKNE